MHKNTLYLASDFLGASDEDIEKVWANPNYKLPQLMFLHDNMLMGNIIDNNVLIHYYLLKPNSSKKLDLKDEKKIEEIFIPEIKTTLIKTRDFSDDELKQIAKEKLTVKPSYTQESSGWAWVNEPNKYSNPNPYKKNEPIIGVDQDDYPVLDKILKEYGKWYPKFLGGGWDGAAWSISPKLVLKIFNTKSVYDSYKNIMNLIWSGKATKHDIMVYDVGALPKSGLYWVVMEKVDTPNISSDTSQITNLLQDQIRTELVNNKEFNEIRNTFIYSLTKADFKKQDILYKKIEEFDLKNKVKDFADRFGYDFATRNPEFISSFNEWMNENNIKVDLSNFYYDMVFAICWNLMFGRADTHLGNMGWRKNFTPTFFDPTFNWMPDLELKDIAPQKVKTIKK